MSNSIFDLEQQIMECWNVVNDLDMLYKYVGDDPFFQGMDSKHEDKLMNLLLGMKEMYDLKYENMWKTFEKTCSEYHRATRFEKMMKAGEYNESTGI